MSLPSGVVTFLFTDVVGSSAKWDRARGAMESALRRHDEILEKAIDSHAGVIVKKTGDGFMAAFADPAAALKAAIEAQQGLVTEQWDDAVGDLAPRVGIDTGPAHPDGGDYLGPTPTRAARIEAAGHGARSFCPPPPVSSSAISRTGRVSEISGSTTSAGSPAPCGSIRRRPPAWQPSSLHHTPSRSRIGLRSPCSRSKPRAIPIEDLSPTGSSKT